MTEKLNVSPGSWLVRQNGKNGQVLCAKLDLSGIMNMQTLISGYYAPLEISIFMDDARVCLQTNDSKKETVGKKYEIKNPRLCIDEIVVTPQYTAAFDAALVERSSSNGVQMSFDTYSVFTNPVGKLKTGTQTFWLRQPVQYLRGFYWGAVNSDDIVNKSNVANCGGCFNGRDDAFDFVRGAIARPTGKTDGGGTADALLFQGGSCGMISWQVSVGSKNYREIKPHTGILDKWDVSTDGSLNQNYEEDDVIFFKVICRYGEPGVGTDEYRPEMRKFKIAQTGIDFDNSPDSEVLSCETTLANNDVRLAITMAPAKGEITEMGDTQYRCYSVFHFQGAMSLFPGNECRLLVV